MTVSPEEWWEQIRSYRRPYKPELIWYLSQESATLNMLGGIVELLDAPKVSGDIIWIGREGYWSSFGSQDH